MFVLLIIIYLAFISLGLPDSLLGSAWPAMHETFGVGISSAGLVFMITAGGTIVSSLISSRLLHWMGTGMVTLLSVAMTAVALTGISCSESFYALCLWSLPLGMGGGSVDAALNHFVATRYKAVHMNLLHGFWGIGTTVGPLILSCRLQNGGHWDTGYRNIALIQFSLALILLFALPLWKRKQKLPSREEGRRQPPPGLLSVIKLPGAKAALSAFFCYGALESGMLLWGGSYLVFSREIPAEIAAGWVAFFFFGLTLGRFLSGILSLKLSSQNMIRLGMALIAAGVFLLLLPIPAAMLLPAFFCIGIGCAPIFPGLLHDTPRTFGESRSQAMIGMQMACAYTGSTFMPPLWGLLSTGIPRHCFPFYLAAFLLLMMLAVHKVYRPRHRPGEICGHYLT